MGTTQTRNEWIHKKYKVFYKKHGYIPPFFNPYNEPAITNFAKICLNHFPEQLNIHSSNIKKNNGVLQNDKIIVIFIHRYPIILEKHIFLQYLNRGFSGLKK